MLSVKLIEAVLIEQDPEGLISLGTPSDEYESEAIEIYKRLISKQTKRKTIELIDYISTIAFVMCEAFGSGTQYDGDNEPSFWYSEKYISKRLDQIKIIAKLIFDIASKKD